MARILTVDDEETLVELLKYNLEKEGHKVLVATNGDEALTIAQQDLPDLVLLDIMMPGKDGFEVCKTLRKFEQTRNIPIIMISARGEEIDKVIGLELGADDFVTKPFSMRELLARVKAQLRRREPAFITGKSTVNENLHFGELVIRPKSFEVFLQGKAVTLTLKEFELLKILASNYGKVLTRVFLLESIWGFDYSEDTRTVDVHIRYLRQKIETDPSRPVYIETVRGVGYRFKKPEK